MVYRLTRQLADLENFESIGRFLFPNEGPLGQVRVHGELLVHVPLPLLQLQQKLLDLRLVDA